jgi:hypothetical protein
MQAVARYVVFLIVFSVLLITNTASEIYIRDYLKPTSLFASLFYTTIIAGFASTMMLEQLEAQVFTASERN